MYLLQELRPTNVGENQKLRTLAESFELDKIKESFKTFVLSGTKPINLIIVKQLPLSWKLDVTTEDIFEEEK